MLWSCTRIIGPVNSRSRGGRTILRKRMIEGTGSAGKEVGRGNPMEWKEEEGGGGVGQ